MYTPNSFSQIDSKKELFDLIQFIVKENYSHHTVPTNNSSLFTESYTLYQEEAIFYEQAEYFIAKNVQEKIVGAIRVCKYTGITLPIEKIFNINIENYANTKHPIFHIGRFAINNQCKSIVLLKKLLLLALTPLKQHPQSVAFAECDAKLFRTLKTLGIQATPIGGAINYLGSSTLPILIRYQDFISFYKDHSYLLANQYELQRLKSA